MLSGKCKLLELCALGEKSPSLCGPKTGQEGGTRLARASELTEDGGATLVILLST